jgi:hypothetical protein
MTPLDAIRAKVEEVRREHGLYTDILGRPMCLSCEGCRYPCDALKGWEAALKMAELLLETFLWLLRQGARWAPARKARLRSGRRGKAPGRHRGGVEVTTLRDRRGFSAPRVIDREIHDHEVYLRFYGDSGAEDFWSWWHEKGEADFFAWEPGGGGLK